MLPLPSTSENPIRKLLVANRGEIARRVFRTCRRLGIATVAVHSDPDRDAPFVAEADEAVSIGGSAPADSYLRADKVIAAARQCGADAIHPGYGFLSENAEFARACAVAGLVFVGPSPDAIDRMGSKLGARALMERAGVPVLPGADLRGLDDTAMLAAAERVGYPVLVKASYGGGGRGMRIVREPVALLDAVASARREAGAAFGNDTVFVERYVDAPRHIEVQVIGDQHGTIVSLHERECSIQRRHQKIIEEAPSPVVDPAMRAAMGQAAVAAAAAVGYVGAGTVEFIVAPDGEFSFLEMNTRLQVEHPVTELVTGLDLVHLQVLVAEGRPLPPAVRDASLSGWAIEARLYAEDPSADYRPAAGTLRRFRVPSSETVRVDSGFEDASVVSVNYDPMLAKVIGYGSTRREAARALASALRRAEIHGVTTNRDLLVAILEEPEFLAGAIDTHYLERHAPHDLVGEIAADARDPALVAAALAQQAARRQRVDVLASVPSGFRNNRSAPQSVELTCGERTHSVSYALGRDATFTVDGAALAVDPVRVAPDAVTLSRSGRRVTYRVNVVGSEVFVDDLDVHLALVEVPRFGDPDDEPAPGSLVAPMPGTISRVPAEVGRAVSRGEVLVVMEAMKMEHQIVAPADATVSAVLVEAGATVDLGQPLVVLQAIAETVDDDG